jgi:hypothetical protein
MALCGLRGAGPVASQRLVVATADRLLLVENGLLTGRERLREFPLDSVRRVAVNPPGRLDLVLSDGPTERSWVQPARQLAALACLIGARLDPTRASASDCHVLFNFARRRLGRLAYVRAEPSLVALAVELGADEEVLDVRSSTTDLVAATTHRLLLVPEGVLRPAAPHRLQLRADHQRGPHRRRRDRRSRAARRTATTRTAFAARQRRHAALEYPGPGRHLTNF